MIRTNSASILQVKIPATGYGGPLRSALEGDQRDCHLNRVASSVEADELSHFRRLVGGGQHRRVIQTADDDVADSRQVIRWHGAEEPSGDGLAAAAYVGSPIQ
jgi:hypothetical protein